MKNWEERGERRGGKEEGRVCMRSCWKIQHDKNLLNDSHTKWNNTCKSSKVNAESNILYYNPWNTPLHMQNVTSPEFPFHMPTAMVVKAVQSFKYSISPHSPSARQSLNISHMYTQTLWRGTNYRSRCMKYPVTKYNGQYFTSHQ